MKKVLGTLVIGMLLLVSHLGAGGWNNTLMGCRALGLGAAFVGVADDPSAVFYNPAGLAFQQERLALSLDGFYVMPEHIYTLPNGYTAESRYTTSIPQLFLSYKASERLTLGFGAYIPYAGGGIDWSEKALGFPFKSYLGVLSLTPSLAFQINDWISIGFNLNFYKGFLNVRTRMDPFGPMEADEVGSTLSFGAGLLLRPRENLRFGFSLRAPAKMRLEGTTAITVEAPQIGTVKMKLTSSTEFNLPWDLEAGVAYQPWSNFLLSLSVQYTMWSTLQQVDKTIQNVPFVGTLQEVEVMNFKNILIFHAGCEFRVAEGFYLRAGLGYDRSASPAESLNFTNIDVDKFTLLGGIGYRAGRVTLDFAYVYAQGKERQKSVITPLGFPALERYNMNVNILGLGVTFHF